MPWQDINRTFARLSLGSDGRLRLYRKIAGLLSNGVSLQAALDVLYDQASKGGRKPNDPQAMAVDSWRRSYREGRGFSTALQGWAPTAERMLVEAGESGSRLDESLKSVIDLNRNVRRMRGALVGGLAYPIALLLLMSIILAVFGIRVLPQFAEILPMERWTGPASGLAVMSQFVQNWGLQFLILVIVAIIAFFYTAPRWSGRLRSTFDRIPPWSLYRLMTGGGFLLSTAALVNAGVAVPEVLRKLRRAATPWMQVRIDAALREVNQGANLGDALHRTGYGFPDQEIVDDLRIYASLASFDESLRNVADEWIEAGVERIETQSRVLNITLLFVIAGLIVLILVGLYGLQTQMKEAAEMGGL